MPLPRTPERRYTKWSKKYNPDVIRTRFADVSDEAHERAQAGLIVFGDLDFTIGPILDKHGIAGPDRAKFLAFARKIMREAMRISGKALDNVVLGLKSYFVTAYGLDPAVADEIIKAIIGYVPTY